MLIEKGEFCMYQNLLCMESVENPSRITLTGREKEILQLLAEGLTSTQIAERLHLSSETILWYRKRLHRKFEVSSVVALVLKAAKMNMI